MLSKLSTLLFGNPTIFFIGGIVLITFLLPVSVIGLFSKGHGDAMAAGILLMGVAGLFLVTIVDRFLVYLIGNKTLNILELVMILGLGIFFFYYDRTIIIETKHEYAAILPNDGTYENAPLTYVFPFNYKLKMTTPIVFLDPKHIDLRRFAGPEHFNRSSGIPIHGTYVNLFYQEKNEYKTEADFKIEEAHQARILAEVGVFLEMKKQKR